MVRLRNKVDESLKKNIKRVYRAFDLADDQLKVVWDRALVEDDTALSQDGET